MGSEMCIRDRENQIVSFNDFLPADSFMELDVPANVSNLSVTINGYKNEDDYAIDFRDQLFRTRPDDSSSLSTITIPLIDEYPIIEQDINLSIDEDTSFFISQRGVSPVVIPNVSIERVDDRVLISGNYNHSEIQLFFPEGLWRYFQNSTEEIRIPYDTFEMPQEIAMFIACLLYTSPSPRDLSTSRMPSSA